MFKFSSNCISSYLLQSTCVKRKFHNSFPSVTVKLTCTKQSPLFGSRGPLFEVPTRYFSLSSPLFDGHFDKIYHTSATDLQCAWRLLVFHFLFWHQERYRGTLRSFCFEIDILSRWTNTSHDFVARVFSGTDYWTLFE